MVESSEAQLEEVRQQQQVAEDEARSAKAELKIAQVELERALPFEKEVKEKNLQIGKLRHQNVILNDHLTKALRFIKQRNPEDMIDRYATWIHGKVEIIAYFLQTSGHEPLPPLFNSRSL